MTLKNPPAVIDEGTGTIGESLETMRGRLEAILSDPLTDDTFVELMAIYNNVAYIFLYLEAIDDQEGFTRLLTWRASFYEDPELDRRIERGLRDLRCEAPDLEENRKEYLSHLRSPESRDLTADAETDRLLGQAKAVLTRIEEDQRQVLERLGARTEAGSVAAVYYKLLSGTVNAKTRGKLTRVWTARRDAHLGELLERLDGMVAVRRERSAREGYESVAARTLHRSRISEADITAFLDRYLTAALAAHERLQEEVRAVTGVTDRPMSHFGFAMQTVFGGSHAPMFALDECLDYAFAVAQNVFGLTLERLESDHPQVLKVGVRSGEREVGHILFDLWDLGRKRSGANHTLGIRNRTQRSGMVQCPVAYVSCRFRRDPEGVGRLTFQNVHSIFHEFGHALNHLLTRKTVPLRSGLEYLPPERVECLSMWFEKWAYHPEFARHLSASSPSPEELAWCVRVKMIEHRSTYLERAITAAVDLDVHRRSEGGLEDAFRRLDERHGISRHYRFGDIAAYFTWPMYMANPGANFSYLWGAADSAQNFADFRSLSLDEIAVRPKLRERFSPCFDADAPGPIPDVSAIFDLYESSTLTESV